MGLTLEKWASRVSGYIGVPILAQRVYTIMARYALDYGADVKDESGKSLPAVSFVSREKIAREIYPPGPSGKVPVRNLDRPIAELRARALIEPRGKAAAKGRNQEYYLRVAEYVATIHAQLEDLYPSAKDREEITALCKRGAGPAWKH